MPYTDSPYSTHRLRRMVYNLKEWDKQQRGQYKREHREIFPVDQANQRAIKNPMLTVEEFKKHGLSITVLEFWEPPKYGEDENSINGYQVPFSQVWSDEELQTMLSDFGLDKPGILKLKEWQVLQQFAVDYKEVFRDQLRNHDKVRNGYQETIYWRKVVTDLQRSGYPKDAAEAMMKACQIHEKPEISLDDYYKFLCVAQQ